MYSKRKGKAKNPNAKTYINISMMININLGTVLLADGFNKATPKGSNNSNCS